MTGHVNIGLRIASLGICLFAGGCAGLHLDQKDGDAIVRTQGYDQTFPDGPIAARLLPYALLAEQAYVETQTLHHAPRPFAINCPQAGSDICALKGDYERRANAILGRYRLIGDYKGPLECRNRSAPGCNFAVNGLGIHIWRRNHTNGVCAEAVVTFRGTDSGSLGDWLSNFHSITRILPIHDQYEQVQDSLGEILDKIGSCRKQGGQVISVGHSLGGGLAQHAAYADKRIRRVYAFNPSMVTAYYDVHLTRRSHNERGLKIERAYEHGEILAYPRYFARQLYPPTGCNPRIVHIRFSRLHGNSIFQHSMHESVIGYLKASQRSEPEKRPVVDLPCS